MHGGGPMMHSCHGRSLIVWQYSKWHKVDVTIIIVRSNHRCVAKLIELPCHVDTDIKLDLTVVYLHCYGDYLIVWQYSKWHKVDNKMSQLFYNLITGVLELPCHVDTNMLLTLRLSCTGLSLLWGLFILEESSCTSRVHVYLLFSLIWYHMVGNRC